MTNLSSGPFSFKEHICGVCSVMVPVMVHSVCVSSLPCLVPSHSCSRREGAGAGHCGRRKEERHTPITVADSVAVWFSGEALQYCLPDDCTALLNFNTCNIKVENTWWTSDLKETPRSEQYKLARNARHSWLGGEMMRAILLLNYVF